MKEKSLTVQETLCKDQIEQVALEFPQVSIQTHHKIAVLRWFADELKLDTDQRKALGAAFAKTPSGFGCNDSQLRQQLGFRRDKTLAATIVWC